MNYPFERRSKQRVNCSYPALVRGQVESGKHYEARAVLTNMSASGMYLLLKHDVAAGEQLLVVVRMSTAPLSQVNAPSLAAAGEVVRIESKVDGTYGVALRLSQHRFL